MSKLLIANNLRLPVDAITQPFAILAKRGAGKTYLASVMAEEMLEAGQQIVALDPTGAWFGLRSGYSIVVLGGDHGDIPLEENAGELIAQAIVANRFSAVLDLSAFRKGQMIRFMVAFAETLYRLNRHPLHLFVDEADAVAPQGRNFGGEENRMLGAMEDIVRRGRKRGIGCTLITQRPAVLNKNVLTQCESLFTLRLTHPRDIDAVMEWINVHADTEQAANVVRSLPTLAIGDAWFWSPGWMGILERIHVRERRTFDSGATPKPGERPRAPKQLAQVDLTALGDQIKAAAESAKANDPRELKRRIADLEKQLRERPKEAVERTVEKTVEVPVLKNGQLVKTENLLERTEALAQRMLSEVAETRKVMQPAFAAPAPKTISPPPPRPIAVFTRPTPKNVPATAAPGEADLGRGGDRRMLIALAQHADGLTASKLSILTAIARRGGTWRTYMGRLRGQGWVVGDNHCLLITQAGLAILGAYEPLPTGEALIHYWRNQLGDSGMRRIFDAAVEAYPGELSPAQLSERTGIALGMGTWRTYMGKLRGLELIEGHRMIRASPSLFEDP